MAGGLVGSRYGWRAAFLLVGLPSVALTILAWRLGDPPRGAQDHLTADGAGRPPDGFFEGVVGLFRTPTFVMVCAVGMLVAFSIGAFNHWLPLYLHRVKQFTVPEASFWFGVLSASGRTPRRRQRAGSSGTCWRAGPRPGTSSRSPAASCSRPRPASS